MTWNIFEADEGGWVRQNTTVCVLTDPPTLICIKHNGDDESEDI